MYNHPSANRYPLPSRATKAPNAWAFFIACIYRQAVIADNAVTQYIKPMPATTAGQREEKTMTYKINTQNTGLETDEQARQMAALMQADGYDVEFTPASGAVQGCDENGEPITCPVGDQDWNRYMELASEA
jgi:hypothetical protein